MAEQYTRVEVDGQRLRISNLDKVLYPGSGTTKGEVLHYYASVAPALLPHLAGRPVTRIRWPHGTDDETSFFEKNLPPGAPDWLASVRLDSPGSRTGEPVTYPLVDGLAALTYLADLASLELHVPQWTVVEGEPVNPDRLVIDLDPGAPAGLHQCAQVALQVRERLADRGLSCAPVTSGSKGLHLYAALDRSRGSDEARDLAREVAEELARENPLVVATMTRSKRPGKVFLDWSQNVAAKTTISPYSLRGKHRPFVATPRTWAEIEAGAEEADALRHCVLEEVLERVEEHGDLFGELLGA